MTKPEMLNTIHKILLWTATAFSGLCAGMVLFYTLSDKLENYDTYLNGNDLSWHFIDKLSYAYFVFSQTYIFCFLFCSMLVFQKRCKPIVWLCFLTTLILLYPEPIYNWLLK